MAKTPIFSVLKAQESKSLGTTVLSLLKAAGWEDISSNPATDFIVMHSKGESGDANYCFQMKVGLGPSYDMQFRLSGTYTPGAPGSAGVFAVPSAQWFNVPMASQTGNYTFPSKGLTDLMQDLFYNINKDCCKIVTAPPVSTYYWGALTGSRFFVIGSPDLYYTTKSSKDVIYITNCPLAANEPIVISTSEAYSEATGNTTGKIDLINQRNAHDLAVTCNGDIVLKPLTIVHNVSGAIGELQGIYGISSTTSPGLVFRNIAQDDKYEYNILRAISSSNIGNTMFYAIATKQL